MILAVSRRILENISSFLTRKAKAKISSSKCEKSKANSEISKSRRSYICFASTFPSRKAILKQQKQKALLNGYDQLNRAQKYQILPKRNNYLNKTEKGNNSVVFSKKQLCYQHCFIAKSVFSFHFNAKVLINPDFIYVFSLKRVKNVKKLK